MNKLAALAAKRPVMTNPVVTLPMNLAPVPKPEVRRTVLPKRPPEGRCDCCPLPARLWAQILTPGILYVVDGVQHDGPSPVKVCTQACAHELAKNSGWPGKKSTVRFHDV